MADTNIGGKFYVAVDGSGDVEVHNSDLNQAGYEALTWLEVKSVGSIGETGSTTNIVNYDTWDTTVTQKGAGITNAGDPEVEVAYIATDPGQVQMRVAGSDANRSNNFAFKITRLNGSIYYERGLVAGVRHPNDGPEDFQREVYALALNQLEIVVNP
jgi:hypothetical protein